MGSASAGGPTWRSTGWFGGLSSDADVAAVERELVGLTRELQNGVRVSAFQREEATALM